jgi:prepilin-type N-terminal cleavage/methylation domain-containing protein
MRARTRGQKGFTLVEVVVATIILTVGLLGVAGATTTVVRRLGDEARRSRADAVARRRLEWLAAAGSCAALADGSALEGAVEERWTVRADTLSRTAAVTAEVTVGGAVGRSAHRRYAASYATVVPC